MWPTTIPVPDTLDVSDRPHTLLLQDALAAYLGEQPDTFDDWWAVVGVLLRSTRSTQRLCRGLRGTAVHWRWTAPGRLARADR